MRLKYLFVLLAAVLFVWPQVGYCQDEEESDDPVQIKIDSLLNSIKPDTPDSVRAKNYAEIAKISYNIDTILRYGFLGLDFCRETNIQLIALCNFYIAQGYWLSDQSKVALPYAIKSINLFQSIDDQKNASSIYLLMSRIYEDLNNLDSTKYYINLALNININRKDTSQISTCYRMLGRIFFNKSYYKDAEQYVRKAIALDSLSNNIIDYAYDYYELGLYYVDMNSIESLYTAKEYLLKAIRLQISAKTDYHKDRVYTAYYYLAGTYIRLADYTNNNEYADSCSYYIKKVLDYYIKQGYVDAIINCGHVYVDYLLYYKKYNEALAFFKSQKEYYDEDIDPRLLMLYYDKLKAIYVSLGDYKNAYECYVKYTEYRESDLNDSTMNAMSDMKTEQAMMIEKLDREKAEAIHAAEKQKMHIVIISLIGGLLLISLLVFFIFRALEIKKKANAELLEKNAILIEQKEEIQTQRDEIEDQKEEIEAQRDEIMAQRDHIEEQRDRIEAQNKEIQASISYAQRIQRSLLTPSETINRIFPDHFLLYKPRNIVSGDYYWVGQFGDNKVCIVADCTGHGVPGGFMSVLGMSNLNHIVGQDVTPDMILNRLREEIIVNLRQSADAPTALQDSNGAELLTDNTDRSRDGMDVAAYVVNERLMKLSFAGANNPLVLIRNNEVQVLKADKMPVGIYARLDPFQCTTIDIQRGDCLYTFSDGFQDQFGYESGKKFLSKRLRELLLEIHQQPMAEQKAMLNTVYEEWRGPVENQTDDVVVMGVRI